MDQKKEKRRGQGYTNLSSYKQQGERKDSISESNACYVPKDCQEKQMYQRKRPKQDERRKINEQKLDSKKKRQRLSLVVRNFNDRENNLSHFLKKVTRVSFTLHDVKYDTQKRVLFCIAEFLSTRQSRDALNDFYHHNKRCRGQNDLRIDIQQPSKPQISMGTKLAEYLDKMSNNGRGVLLDHEDKILKLDQHLNETLTQNKDGNPIRVKDEVKAIEFKLKEMQLQKKEFQDFLRCTIDEVEKIKSSKITESIDNYLKEVYDAFNVECKRLQSALPMYARRTDIISTVKGNQISVLLGETGSGKSTQIAQYMYQSGFANKGLIVCTQPRKIAAISLAVHVAQELGTSVGNLVGYKVGMQVRQCKETKIMYMTDHMLLNECLNDTNLSAYSCIIVDEAHERSIYTDLLLGMIKKSTNNRKDLRVVVTSATIKPDVFVNYFGSSVCPVLSITGRMFPVDIIWSDEDSLMDDYEKGAIEKTLEIHDHEAPGDILVFLTSPLEVERCCTSLVERKKSDTNIICLPLHGRLQPMEQQKVFENTPKGKRKIVFATNSAETSVTIPGIKYVIDTGVAKEMQFDPKRNISTLSVKTITKSSADQRKGRAGRTEPGKCYRLYTNETYNEMDCESRPEILRVHLGHAFLKLMELGVIPLEFDFVQAPPRELMDAAMETLEYVGAVKKKKITELGKWIAKLPLDPKFGAFVHDAIKDGVGIEAMILSACCGASGSLFYRSGTDQEKIKADKLKVRFCHEGGDLLTMLNVYREWHQQPEKEKGPWCAKNSINGKSIRGIRESVNEVLSVLRKDLGAKPKFNFKEPSLVDKKLQKLLFRTFAKNVCHFLGHEKAGYLVANKNQRVQLFPASSLKPLGLLPNWIVMEEVLNTSREYAINVTVVDDEVIQQAIKDGWIDIDIKFLSEQRVEPIAFFEVGEHTFREFVGTRFTKLRMLEDSARKSGQNNILIIEASRQTGEIGIFTQKSENTVICQDIANRIESLKNNTRLDKSEQFLSSSKVGVRVEIGAGLNVLDVMMADEYKTIFVTGIPKFIEEKSEEDIKYKFQHYGQIVKMEKFVNSKNKNNWGRITFSSREEAERAVNSVKGDLDVSARPSIGFRSADVRGFRTKLQWCRRRSRGFGFVGFKDFLVAARALMSTVYIGGTVVKIKRSKTSASEIHVGNLNPHVNEDVLRQGFIDSIGLEATDIIRVTVIRQKVNTTREILDTFKQRLRTKLKEYVTEGTFELDLREPKEGDYTFLAFVSFSKSEEGIAACAGIDHKFSMNDEVVTMKADIKTSVMIPQPVFSKYSDQVDELVNDLNSSENINIHLKTQRNGNVILNLHSESIETILHAKNTILAAVRGIVMDIDSYEDISRLFSWGGKRLIKSVMESTGTDIVTDDRILSIAIHGDPENQTRASRMLEKYLTELKNEKTKIVSLKGEDKPPGVMKELMVMYEYDLNKLISETGLKCIDLNHRWHSVTLVGDDTAIEKAMVAVEDVIKIAIGKTNDYRVKSGQTRDCAICLCPVDEGEIYRLETCGHAYCKGCVEMQFKSNIKSNTLPIACSAENCNEFWSWKDIEKHSTKTCIPIAVLVKKTTSIFVARNKKTYRYCPTADCPLIYRVTEKGKLFNCPECEVRICTSCHNQFHDGLTCETVEKLKKDDGGLLLWMRHNTGRAKLCPKCTTPIEKIDGCNHMTCLGCKAHICWVCLRYFQTSGECYGHMQSEHGNFI